MIELLLLAFGLSMDAFAVSIGLGVKSVSNKIDIKRVAIKAALFFGFFQAFMSFLGYLAGNTILEYIASFDHWIAFILLLIIGLKMIYEAFFSKENGEVITINNKTMLFLAIATSIDALAAGFTLQLFSVSLVFSIITIGIVTLFMSYIGVFIGLKSGLWLKNRAEIVGGLVLIGIGFKILLTS